METSSESSNEYNSTDGFLYKRKAQLSNNISQNRKYRSFDGKLRGKYVIDNLTTSNYLSLLLDAKSITSCNNMTKYDEYDAKIVKESLQDKPYHCCFDNNKHQKLIEFLTQHIQSQQILEIKKNYEDLKNKYKAIIIENNKIKNENIKLQQNLKSEQQKIKDIIDGKYTNRPMKWIKMLNYSYNRPKMLNKKSKYSNKIKNINRNLY